MKVIFFTITFLFLAQGPAYAQGKGEKPAKVASHFVVLNPWDFGRENVERLSRHVAEAATDSARVDLMVELANAYRTSQMMDSSIHMYKEALALGKKIGRTEQWQTWQIGTIDYLLWETGNYTESLKYAEEELAISRRIKDTLHLGFVHLIIGHNYASLEGHQAALEEFGKAHDMFQFWNRNGKLTGGFAYVYQCIGEVYLNMRVMDSALLFTRLAMKQAEASRKSDDLLFSTRVHGDIYRMSGDSSNALRYYRRYLNDVNSSETRNRELGFVYNSMSQIFWGKKEKDSSFRYAELAFQNARRYDDKETLYRAASLLSDHYEEHDRGKAFEYLKIAEAAKDSVVGFERMRQAQILAFNQQVKDRQLAESERKEMARRRFGYIFVGALFLVAAFLLWYYLRELSLKYKAILKQKEEDNVRTMYEKQIVELEARALRAQMNPHFIFNCMNSIKGLIQHQEEEKAVSYLTTFSSLLRGLLQSSDKREISLHDELEICNLYVRLESMRFGDKLKYTFIIDEGIDLKSVMLPAMIIQPFIENAIWHGILPKPEGGNLSVSVGRSSEGITCIIDDDGIGREVARTNAHRVQADGHRSKGLSLVKSRLDLDGLLNQRDATLLIEDKYNAEGAPAGTRICLTLSDY